MEYVVKNGSKNMRTREEAIKLLEQITNGVIERYLDPKNEAKGTHLNIEPLKMHKLISAERLEAEQAYRRVEGDERELSELHDLILCACFRADQIINSALK